MSSTYHALEPFLEMMASERGASALTVDAYRQDIFSWVSFLEKPLQEATTQDVRAFLTYMSEQGLSESTIARRLSTLRQLYSFLYMEKEIPGNPLLDIKLPKPKKASPGT